MARTSALFAGSDGGARRWPLVGSPVETAKPNEIEPHAWLRDLLSGMVGGYPRQRLGELIPWRQAEALSLNEVES